MTIGVREIIPHSHPLAVSAGVFERCSSTGSESFSLSIAFTWRYQFCTTYSVFTLLEAICSKNVQQNHSPNMTKHGKSPLTIDVRPSKTSLLIIFSIFKRYVRSTSSVGKKGYFSVKRLYHSTDQEFKQKLIKWWSIIGVLQYMAIILNYLFSSNNSRGNYFFFLTKRGQLIQGRRLFEGGNYFKYCSLEVVA